MLKRWLWIIVPALLIALLWGYTRTASDWHYVISADAGTLVFAASFDGDANATYNDDWEQYPGRQSAQIIESAMRINVGAPSSGNYSLAAHRYTDFEAHVRAQAIEGPENNGYGMIFRLSDRDTYYRFMVSSDGYYSVQRVLNGEIKYLSNWIITTLDLPELNGVRVNTGLNAINELAVIAHGDTFEFYINGVRAPLCIPNDPAGESTYYEFFATPEERCVQGTMTDTLIDSSIAQGQIGVVAQSFDFGETDRAVVIDFLDMVVYAQ